MRTHATLRYVSWLLIHIGETFWENGVQSLIASTHGEKCSHGEFAELIKEEIIEKTAERRFTSEIQYRFRHALVRDAAYGLVSAEEKVAGHAAAGAFLESMGEPDAVALAEHFRIGQQMPQAIRYYTRAAEQAFDGSGVDAALDCVERGLASGAQGLERGILLSMQVRIAFWHEEFEKIIRLGPETVSLLPVGDKRWAHAMEGLLSITTFTQPQAVPQMAEQFLASRERPLARAGDAVGLRYD